MRSARQAVRQRLYTFLGLLGLATASLLCGEFVRWPGGGVAISLTIAVVKAVLVLWFFMDMVDQPFRARIAIALAVVLVALLVGLTATDVATRLVMPRGPSPLPGQAFYQR